MDRMVEIARFTYPSEAGPLMALLESEGIECYLRNELTAQIMAGYADVGGARVEILEKDLPRALEIMKEGGYERYEDTLEDERLEQVGTWTRHIPGLRRLPFEKQILFFFALIAIMLALLIYLSSFFS